MRLHRMKNSLRSRWLALFGVVVAIFMVVAWVSTVKGDAEPDLPEPSAPLLDQQTFVNNVATTEAIELREQQDQQEARARTDLPPKSGSEESIGQGYSDPALVYGIVSHPVLLAGWGGVYAIENGWIGSVSGRDIYVSAGAKADVIGSGIFHTPEQGVLVIHGNGPNLYGEYLTPTRTGAGRVTAYNGACLTLTSTGSATYYFDVSQRTWYCGPPPNSAS